MMFLPLRETPRQLPLTDLTFCSYQLTLFTPPLQPLRTATCTGQRILDTKSQKLDVKKINK